MIVAPDFIIGNIQTPVLRWRPCS